MDAEHYAGEKLVRRPDAKTKKRRGGAGKLVLAAGLCAAAVYALSGSGLHLRLRMPCHKGHPPPATDEAAKWQTEGWYPSPRGGTVPSWAASYEKAAALVEKMSLLEKVNITTGTGWQQGLCVGNTGPAPSVGFPSLCLQDGPLGLRFADHATAWPAALTVGATWNRELMYKRGHGHGTEARNKGVHVLLGPSMGPLGRMPAGGRNWEGFGPDPYLQGVAAAQTIRGIQDAGVIATAKHFILNEQEHFRQLEEWDGLEGDVISSNVDDRTMHEMYLWPFADSVHAGVGSVMCSYNQVNNTYACGNSQTLNHLLKDELGFQGFVQSDWFAQRRGLDDVLAGLDMNMPGNIFQHDAGTGYTLFGGNLTAAVMNSSIPLSRLDDMATRVVAAWYQMGQDDPEKFPAEGPNFSSWTDDETGYLHWAANEGPQGTVNKYVDVQADHWTTARQIAVEGTVLVKNTGLLPLRPDAYAEQNIGLYGEDAGADDQKGFPNFCKDRGCNVGSLGSGWGSGAVEYPHFHTPQAALRRAFNGSAVTAITDNAALPAIAESARNQSVCIAFVNSDAGEGYITDPTTGVAGDRADLYAQKGGDALVLAVADHCRATVVVVHAVGPVVLERWISHPSVAAVLLAHLPGQESGEALAALLTGAVNPSGKLPYTVGKSLSSYGPGGQIMYTPNARTPQQTFEEGREVDYRYFDANNITPRFAFGFGLSYTTFAVSDAAVVALAEKSPFPPPRPEMLAPPRVESKLPAMKDVLFPQLLKRLRGYIYPYLSSAAAAAPAVPLPPPREYDTPREPSPAGGGEGGHPALWEPMARVTATVRNTGKMAGAEVVQVYVDVGPAGDSVRTLRGFEKVFLEAGEERQVVVVLKRRDVSYWDTEAGNWRVPEGVVGVWVGTSSSAEGLVKVGF
ncbi:glycoside hydrolase family 3 protein [Geopyxis carbonaria]|nr:glycoside hydrolase family 3 protein [Geopyxis carbonaria]